MWYFNGQIIKTPKSMEISDVLYPRTIFRDSTTLTSLGIKAYREVTPDSRYYWNGEFTVNTSGSEVVGTYASTARDVATLKANMLEKARTAVASRLADIDWYWSRAAKGGTAVPPLAALLQYQSIAACLLATCELAFSNILDLSVAKSLAVPA